MTYKKKMRNTVGHEFNLYIIYLQKIDQKVNTKNHDTYDTKMSKYLFAIEITQNWEKKYVQNVIKLKQFYITHSGVHFKTIIIIFGIMNGIYHDCF